MEPKIGIRRYVMKCLARWSIGMSNTTVCVHQLNTHYKTCNKIIIHVYAPGSHSTSNICLPHVHKEGDIETYIA